MTVNPRQPRLPLTAKGAYSIFPHLEDYMTLIHGFEQVRDEVVEEYGARAVLYRHAATGAELLSLSLDDENKVFGVSFRTPPADSTGVAHILEHSVLCGSKKYPVKEPFVELLKGSLHTFLNAFTYPDKTCYPVASANLRDFYNLVDVYLDAVFHPLIPERVFLQEGWHYDPAPDGTLARNGVVFNEMKGAYSSPDSVLAEYSQRLLFPDTAYGVDSGGDPKVIPDLTYQAFLDFHRTYYHPGNARFFFYGDDDPNERLRLIDEALAGFGPAEIRSEIALQRPALEPRRAVIPYAADKPVDGAQDKGRFATLNWLLPESADQDAVLAFEVLEHVLIGLPSSPLRKALIDSGLGEDLAGGGLETELRQMFFSTGLKGVAESGVEKVEKLILSTLSSLVSRGVDPEAVEAGVNALEFALRENNTGSFPRGLSLMLRALTVWLHGGDPLAPLRFEGPLARLKARLASGERVFEDMIFAHLINNKSRCALALTPDPELAARNAAEEARRLEDERQAMGEAGLAAAREAKARLAAFQETPDSPEALAAIPRLTVADLPRENKRIPTAIRPAEDAQSPAVHFHDLPTNGVVYLDLGFDMSAVPEELLPLVPLFSRAMLETGTAREDFVTFNRRIARKTGGVRRESFLASIKGQDPDATLASRLIFRGKATLDKAPDLLSILNDALLTARLTDRERLTQMTLEAKARAERALAPSGHAVVSARLRARFGKAGWAAERMRGLSNLFSLRALSERLETDWDGVARDLERLRELIVRRNDLVANVTLDEKSYAAFAPMLEDFTAGLPEKSLSPAVWEAGSLPQAEGVVIPAQINFAGLGFNLYKLGYAFHGSALVISRFLRMSYLWDKVRVQGGAYGAFCSFDRIGGSFILASYRDPNSTRTLDAFAKAGEFLANASLTQADLDQAVIGAIGDIDAYMLPDAQGHAALSRALTGDAEEDRARMRDEVFAAGPEHFKAFGEVLIEGARQGAAVVAGSSETIGKLAAERPGFIVTKAM